MSRIVDVKYFQGAYSKPGHGSVQLTLACGHEETRKKSQFQPGQKRVKCRECFMGRMTQALLKGDK
jgi:hypothetical protein